jgi:hypothetical protein
MVVNKPALIVLAIALGLPAGFWLYDRARKGFARPDDNGSMTKDD